MSWRYTVEKIEKRVAELKRARVRASVPLGDWRKALGPIDGASASDFDDTGWDTFPALGSYEAREQTIWLRSAVTVPEAWTGQRVFLGLELAEAETLVWVDGVATQAIDLFHHDLLLTDSADGGRTYTLALECYTGLGDQRFARVFTPKTVEIKIAELQWIDTPTEALYYDMSVALESAKTMDGNGREYAVILEALDEATNILDFSRGVSDDVFYASAARAGEYLQANLYQKYHADPNFAPTIWATGHAHIDTAWLWRLAHTRQKIGRTFTTALTLMEQYPEYKFTCSQPQQYAYLKQDYPEVYARIQAAIQRGQWEAVGGMWVESDCNVVGGESLVRQFLYGLRFFQQEFGTHTDVVWLPDVFGYAAAFPQIIKKAGMKYFMTIKIYWSQFNKPPYQTFEWEGIDGTSVLTHYSPLGDYNAVMTPAQLRQNWNAYQQKHLTDSDLYIYGYGDGGGGPTRAMLETAARLQDFPGMPKVKLSDSEAFFEDLARQVEGKPNLPRWVGELYLEYHRGTYTSQARSKKLNRQSELLLQTAEQICCLANLTTARPYPRPTLAKAWELTLLNQFHDIIPGSSIREVYEDSERDYQTILGIASDTVQGALGAIADQIAEGAGDVVVYNPLSWPRSDVAEAPRNLNLPGQHVVDLDGQEKTLVHLSDVPALGYDTLRAEALPLFDNTHDEPTLHVTERTLENQFFTLTLDENGEISSLWDKRTQREVIDAGAYCKGNAFLTFEDKPLNYDAWDIDIFYLDKMTPAQSLTRLEVAEHGPIRASIEITRTFGRGSSLHQRISLYRDIARIDFDTEVDWRERHTLLKVAFPVTVRSPRATYDIQFGNVERPTHWNTSWDWARFEVCAHKWADLSEGDYGVSLLSESKYGWDIKDNVMRLTLLKGATSPDPEADLGRQRFTYALLPHAGDWRAAKTVQRAYEFNVPAQFAAVHGHGDLPASMSLVSVDKPNVIVETVKKAEDDESVIVRLYEAYGQRGPAALTFGQNIESAAEVNLLEVETEESRARHVTVDGARLAFDVKPYEIRTLRVRLKA
ncbi:alpha-mannosidase [Capsulimonas corticalis]|uniref:alpha-mannosidase n=1 Tax=Capsulimonas corticalis TaxID=2219043 RepID=A0A402CT59_9BACT|nr:alpha-mannosidase [Capsulimonas corticalis]BDI30852.1 alpha-mannosidase [Capsulimonas corticalis]